MDAPLDPPDMPADEDFITVEHLPNSRPSRYQVQIRRYSQHEVSVTQASEPMGRYAAKDLARKWAYWHRLEVR